MLTQEQLQALLDAPSRTRFNELAASYGMTPESADLAVEAYNQSAYGARDPKRLAAVRDRLMAATTAAEFEQILDDNNITIDGQDLDPDLAKKVAAFEAVKAAEKRPNDSVVQQATVQERRIFEAGGQAGLPTYFNSFVAELRGGQGDYSQLTINEQNAYLAAVEDIYGEPHESFQTLVASGWFNNPTRAVSVLQDVLSDTTPNPAWSVPLPNGRSTTVLEDHMTMASRLWGLERQDVSRLVRMADRIGMRTNDGRELIHWQPLGEILRITGNLGRVSTGETQWRRDGINPPERVPGGIPTGEEITISNRNVGDRDQRDAPMSDLRGGVTTPIDLRRNITGRDISEAYWAAMEQYDNDPTLAVLAVADPQLAREVATELRTYGDIMDGGLYVRVQRTLAAGGSGAYGIEEWAQSMYDAGTLEAGRGTFVNFLTAREREEADRKRDEASAGVTVQLPDPAAVDEQLRSLYQSLFMADPTDQQLAQFRSGINGAVTAMYQGAGQGGTVTSVDVSARALEAARKDPIYQELYGNKPGGMAEADYQNQFRSAQGSMLGNELGDLSPVKAGMRSGSYQTTVGASAATKQAWDNSTFLGRLAQAAAVVRDQT